MLVGRRSFTLGLGAAALFANPLRADDSAEYLEYPFRDYFSRSGRRTSRGRISGFDEDIKAANRIAASMPTDNYFHIMQRLSEITDVGSTGEVFNTRWKKFENPLLVRFFHDIGYKKTPYPGDCTPWCAATLSWCLQRVGLRLPRDPASSQSFLKYGNRVTVPKTGDICVFTDVGDNAHGHVALLVERDADTLSILGGNQSGDSTTNCGPGYRKSKISQTTMPVNKERDRSVGVHYLAAFVRPA